MVAVQSNPGMQRAYAALGLNFADRRPGAEPGSQIGEKSTLWYSF